MEYISGIYALNLNCNLDTCGDWHQSSLNWKKVSLVESNNSFFEEYGLEFNKKIPEHTKTYTTANHIRASLDMLLNKEFDLLQGMNKEFICNDKYNIEIFSQVLKMHKLPYWNEIRLFMDKEYGRKWIKFRKEHLNEQ